MPTILVPFADGVEEMEAVIIVDVLRRAECTVVTAGLKTTTVTASRKVGLVADRLFADVSIDAMDALVLPGGAPGAAAMRADPRILDAARRMFDRGKIVAAICAAPLVLQDAGLLKGRRFTCHPGVKDQFRHGLRVEDRVVEEGNLITSQGPGAAFEFALAVAARLKGKATAAAVATAMVL
jgi:4-methyl-5(b-hydroxyethyl)-thiazole monophosphate biosynthesis